MDALTQLTEIKKHIALARRRIMDDPAKSLEVLMEIEGLVAALNGVEQTGDQVKEMRISVLADLQDLILFIDKQKQGVEKKLKGFANRQAAAKGYGDNS